MTTSGPPSFSDQAFEPGGHLEFDVPAELPGKNRRIDSWISERLRDCSRSYIQKLIRSGQLLLDGAPVKTSRKLAGGEHLAISFPKADQEPAAEPEEIPIPILFEDEHLVVVNKPAGMPTHPSCGHARGTVANAMVWHCGQLSTIGGPVRPGIVHRLDMETSGILLIAKTDPAHNQLSRQFAERKIRKSYLALTHRAMTPPEGLIESPLGRHPVKRKKQAILKEGGRSATTAYETLERLGKYSFLQLQPRTGRTHQIRVHLASCGCPILCDALYGRELSFPDGEALLQRHALHASGIIFAHPRSGKPMEIECPLPDDFANTLQHLRSSAVN